MYYFLVSDLFLLFLVNYTDYCNNSNLYSTAITVGFGLNIPKAGVHSDVNYVIIAYAISFVVIEFLLMQLSKQSNMPGKYWYTL